MTDITVRFADGDNDVVVIHRFLCAVAGPSLPSEIDPKKSATEVWRVINHEVAILALRDDILLGTIGLICVEPWWGDNKYLVNRWAFAIPGSGAWRPLLKEAKAVAVASNMEFHLIAEERGRITIFNRSGLRDQPMLAKSPKSRFAASAYAACASSGESKLPM